MLGNVILISKIDLSPSEVGRFKAYTAFAMSIIKSSLHEMSITDFVNDVSEVETRVNVPYVYDTLYGNLSEDKSK